MAIEANLTAEKQKKIKSLVTEVIEPTVKWMKRTRNIRSMPYKDIGKILNIFFPKTKHLEAGKGFFKRVFVIHSKKRRFALKIGRKKQHIKKDYNTYKRLPLKERNKYYAKIYWAEGLYMLQKYGRKTKVPAHVIDRLKKFGERHGLKDIREANIMKFGKGFKIVDAEPR